MNALRRWWPLLFFALLPLLPLARPVFAGEAIGPWDHIAAMKPWGAPAPEEPWDVLQADGVLQFAVWRDLVFDAWARGQLPLWNPYQLMGTPLLANSQSGAFYPLHILVGLIGMPTLPAVTFLAWFHLFWAGLGTFLVVRRMGGARLGGAVAGGTFALSPFMVSWTPLASVITTVSWIPWALAGVQTVFLSSGDRRDLARGAPLLALSVAMMLLGGHLQFAAYGLLAVAVASIWLLAASRRWSAIVKVALALAVGACLAAPQVLPALRYSQFSHRQNAPTEEGYRAYSQGAVSYYQLAGLAFPSALGNPVQFSPVEAVRRLGSSSYWPAWTKVGANYAESALSVGPLALMLLAYLGRRWRRPETGAVAAVAGIGLLLALGTAANRVLYFGVPGWSASGSPGRASVLVVLALCILAGVGLSELLERRENAPRALDRILLAGAFFLALVPLIAPLPNPVRLDPFVLTGMVARTLFGALPAALLAGVLALGAVHLALRRPGLGRAAMLVSPAVLAPILFNFAFPLHTGKPLPPLEAKPTGRVAVVNARWEILSPPLGLLPPNTAAWHRVHDVAGYDSLLHRDTKAMLDGANGIDSAPSTNGNMMFVMPSFDPAKLAHLGVQEIWATYPIPQLGSPIGSERGVYRFALPSPGRIEGPRGPARLVEDGYDRMEVAAQGPGPLIVRDRNMPGWSASVSGRPASLGEGPFRQVELPEGEHRVVFRYDPPGLRTGMVLALVGIVGLLALAVVAAFPARR